MKLQRQTVKAGKAGGVGLRAGEKIGKPEGGATRHHVDAGGQAPQHLPDVLRCQEDHAGEQKRPDQHSAIVERRGENDQQDQEKNSAGKQPVASEPAPRARRRTGFGADIHERHQQQVAERQRVAVDGTGREPALQSVDEVERRKQQERQP